MEQEAPSQSGGRARKVCFGGVTWGTRVSETDCCREELEIAFVTMCVDLVNNIKSAAILQKGVDGRDILVLI